MKALVIAGSRGLGASIADCLRETYEVRTVARTNADYLFDLMLPHSPSAMADEVIASFGYPDVLVHNLGGTLDITDPYCSIEDWAKVFRLNLGIAVELNLRFVPNMQERGWGRVVHVSSVSGTENQGTVPYCAAKAALNAYTRSFGRVVASDGVCVSAVMPGAVWTEGGYWDRDVSYSDNFAKQRMAIQRLGMPDEIGRFVGFLCSKQASFVVGSTFLVDGGQGRSFGY